jgi:hypothetical protein
MDIQHVIILFLSGRPTQKESMQHMARLLWSGKCHCLQTTERSRRANYLVSLQDVGGSTLVK